MFVLPHRLLSAVALLVLALSASGAASANVIVACTQMNSGTLRVVESAAQCRNGEVAISWNIQGVQGPAGPGAKTIAGLVGADGLPAALGGVPLTPGFESERLGEGEIKISFPAGSFDRFPAMTASTGASAIAHVDRGEWSSEGSARFWVSIRTTGENLPVDRGFWFIAAEGLPAAP